MKRAPRMTKRERKDAARGGSPDQYTVRTASGQKLTIVVDEALPAVRETVDAFFEAYGARGG